MYQSPCPRLGALTDADLDKIRLIVNDSEKRIKEEVKAEITALRQELKTEIADVKHELKAEIAGVNGALKAEVAKSEKNVKEQITRLTNFVYGLIVLIVAAVAIPQLIMTWRTGKERSLERQIQTLTQEIETLKQQRIVNP